MTLKDRVDLAAWARAYNAGVAYEGAKPSIQRDSPPEVLSGELAEAWKLGYRDGAVLSRMELNSYLESLRRPKYTPHGDLIPGIKPVYDDETIYKMKQAQQDD